MECEHCKNLFNSKYSLNCHQQRAKYCLKIQEQKNNILTIDLITCEYCNKQISSHNFERHKNTCKLSLISRLKISEECNLKLKEEISTLKAQLEIYKNLSSDSQQCIKEIAKQPKTTTSNTSNTNNVMNLAPLDMNVLTEKLKTVINEKMTEQHLLEGQEGIAKLIASCFTLEDGKKLITCTDTSRGIWKSKDTNGNILKDVKANNIAKTVQPIAVSKADNLIDLDEKKRNKIYQLRDVEKRKKERLELGEKDMATMRGMKAESAHYRMYQERIHKREEDKKKDEDLEDELLQEFREADELYLINLDDDEKTFKLYAGKEDIKNLKEDSCKFSNSLITLV
jgi:hypothetical protein